MSKTKTPVRASTIASPEWMAAGESSQPLLSAKTLTRTAFVLSLAIVLARATMMEVLRTPLDPMPGSPAVPREPRAATSLVLDLLAWVPALLVLARAAVDRSFRVIPNVSHVLLAGLALWAMLSPLWAADRFAAAVSAFHFLSAGVFLWAAAQLVCSGRRLRIVAGVCAALLAIHGVRAISYQYVERAEMRADWETNRERHLRERGMEPGSFTAQQFEAKLLRGEMMGFHASPNSFAAVTVLLLVVTGGLVVQRLADRDGVGWTVPLLLAVPAGLAVVVWVDSKTAYVTPLIAAGAFCALAVARGALARRAGFAYAAGVAAVVGVAALFVGHGLHHGQFPVDSLTFRWRYWVGAARLFTEHPLLGVGWENFGPYYLGVRLPIAAEEVRDPHNFVVRFFTELGVVGGALLIAWVLRLAWEMTRPRAAASPAVAAAGLSPARPAWATAAVIALAATALSAATVVDLDFAANGGDAGPAYALLQVVGRVVGGLIVFAMLWAATARSLTAPTTDGRPAPWALYGTVIGVGVFLLHNLVDFAMFELGPMFLLALLAGAALGMRTPAAVESATPTTPALRPRAASLAGMCVLWLVAAGGLVVPILLAEGHAAAGDEHVRRGAFANAARSYEQAANAVPYNGEYAFSAARVLQSYDAAGARRAFAAALGANPSSASYHTALAGFEVAQQPPDATRVRAAYDAALALDPADTRNRLRYAQTLEALGLPAEARVQFEQVLLFDDRLAPDEVERLPESTLADVKAAVARLGAGGNAGGK